MSDRIRYIIEGARCEIEQRDGVEGRWETSHVLTLLPIERDRIQAEVNDALARKGREQAKKRLAQIDQERARLLDIIGDDANAST